MHRNEPQITSKCYLNLDFSFSIQIEAFSFILTDSIKIKSTFNPLHFCTASLPLLHRSAQSRHHQKIAVIKKKTNKKTNRTQTPRKKINHKSSVTMHSAQKGAQISLSHQNLNTLPARANFHIRVRASRHKRAAAARRTAKCINFHAHTRVCVCVCRAVTRPCPAYTYTCKI